MLPPRLQWFCEPNEPEPRSIGSREMQVPAFQFFDIFIETRTHPTRRRRGWFALTVPLPTVWERVMRMESLPTRERGLKLRCIANAHQSPLSLPTRERGLKPNSPVPDLLNPQVAPHAGAWIETTRCTAAISTARVAPHAGAWIETLATRHRSRPPNWSLPTRERGLKLMRNADAFNYRMVAPHAGAWIETLGVFAGFGRKLSLPTRERGLKHWRYNQLPILTTVAPHAGAWIETGQGSCMRLLNGVAPHAGAWIETRRLPAWTGLPDGRSPRGSVD